MYRSLAQLRGIAEDILYPEDFIFFGNNNNDKPPNDYSPPTKHSKKTSPPRTDDAIDPGGGGNSNVNSNGNERYSNDTTEGIGDGDSSGTNDTTEGNDESSGTHDNTEGNGDTSGTNDTTEGSSDTSSTNDNTEGSSDTSGTNDTTEGSGDTSGTNDNDESGTVVPPTASPVSEPTPSLTGTHAPFITAIIDNAKDEGGNDTDNTVEGDSTNGNAESSSDGSVSGTEGGTPPGDGDDSNSGAEDVGTNGIAESSSDGSVSETEGGTPPGDGDDSKSGAEDGIDGSSGSDETGVENPATGNEPGIEAEDEITNDTKDEITNDEGEDLICLAIALQERITSPEIEAKTTTSSFAIAIDVLYNAAIASSLGLEAFLNETNPAMAYWIAGCGIHPELSQSSSDKSVRRLRGLQQEEWTPIITYAELDPWSGTAPCDESGSDSDASVCQQPFASRVQIQVQSSSDSQTSDYLQSQINMAFETILKPLLQAQPGVLGVELAGISEEVEQELAANETNSTADNEINDDKRRRIIVLACSIVAAGIFMCMLMMILTGIYRRRQTKMPGGFTKYGLTGQDHVAHVPFEDEVFDDDDDGILHHDLIVDGSRMIAQRDEELLPDEDHGVSTTLTYHYSTGPSDEYLTEEESGEDDYESDGVRDAIPCPYEIQPPCPDSPAPFDEHEQYHPSDARRYSMCSSPTCQTCEKRRRMGLAKYKRSIMIKSITSTEPPNVPMNKTPNTITAPRSDRFPLHIDPNVSSRKYELEDTVDL
eukprot:jgi/Psemu1/327133/estExt_fgenesh1_pg.C_5580003